MNEFVTFFQDSGGSLDSLIPRAVPEQSSRQTKGDTSDSSPRQSADAPLHQRINDGYRAEPVQHRAGTEEPGMRSNTTNHTQGYLKRRKK